MSTSGLMSIGVRGMAAAYAALQTTGHNIANAGVDGYSRQKVELATATSQFSGAGFFGKGVDIQTVSRAHSDYMAREAATSKSLSSMDEARLSMLKELEAIFPMGEQGMGYAAGQFLNAMVDLGNHPADNAARQVVLARANEVAGRFAAAGEQLTQTQNNITAQLGTAVDAVNGLARDIAGVNAKISAVNGLGQPPNDLLDERDRLISRLSEYAQVSTIPAEDGSLGVFIAGGQRLVLGTDASQLSLVADPEDPRRMAIGIAEQGFNRVLQQGSFAGGSMAGWLKFQNTDLVEARTQLGQMGAALAGAVNRQQSLGLDMRDPPGTGAPIFAVGDPLVTPHASNQRNAAGNYTASVALSVTDATQLVASEYDLSADPSGTPGAWQLTRRSDGLVRTVTDGATVDGFTISLGWPPPTTGDKFLLQPVTYAAAGMKRVLDDVRGVAAASPVVASAAPGNAGTGSVASLTVTDPSINPDLSASISFTSGNGDYTWELRDRSTNALVSSGSAQWTAGQPIALNGFEMALNGVPATGDSFSVVKTPYPASSNTNALAMVALRDQTLVGRSVQSNGQLGGGRTFTDAYAATMSSIGVRVQGAATAAQVSSTLAQQTEQTRANESGVNLDEEAARLLSFQQSYQACAKVLNVAQTVFDTLLNAVNH